MKNDYIIKNAGNIKAILMLAVILYHSCIFWAGHGWCEWLSSDVSYNHILYLIYNYLKDCHIYAFTIISGFIFYYCKNHFSKYNSIWNLIKGKYKRLIRPFVYCSILWIIPFDIVLEHISKKELLHDYILSCSPSQLWFLLMLFNVFIVFYLLYEIINRSVICGFLISACLYLLPSILNQYIDNYYQILATCYFFPFFWIGFELAKYPFVLSKIGIKSTIVISIFYVCIVHLNQDTFILLFARRLLGSIAILSLSCYLSKIKIWSNKFLEFFSQNSFKVYLIHQQIIYVIIFFLCGKINSIFNALICFLASIVISLSIIYLINKAVFCYDKHSKKIL